MGIPAPGRGLTKTLNLVLLCYRHHVRVHEGGWNLVRTEDGTILTMPPPDPRFDDEFVPYARGPDEDAA